MCAVLSTARAGWTCRTQHYNTAVFFCWFSGVLSRPMHDLVSPGTALLAMSAARRIAAALLVSAVLWLAAWWAL
jgi:hypothetical protein